MLIQKRFKCMFKKDSNTPTKFLFLRLFRQTCKNFAKLQRKLFESFSFSFGCKAHTCKFGLEVKKKKLRWLRYANLAFFMSFVSAEKEEEGAPIKSSRGLFSCGSVGPTQQLSVMMTNSST